MQLIPNGPHIPEELIQAHEDGKVVFFCGAGISMQAGLPSFKGLLDQTYVQLGCKLSDNAPQESAFKRGEYDRVFHLLERDYPSQKNQIRKVVEQLLAADPSDFDSSPEKLQNHLALLTLSKASEQHLVTTNFDWLFEIAAQTTSAMHRRYSAPLLPVPKQGRWSSLCQQFPEQSLELLDSVIDEVGIARSELKQCLDEISNHSLPSSKNNKFLALRNKIN